MMTLRLRPQYQNLLQYLPSTHPSSMQTDNLPCSSPRSRVDLKAQLNRPAAVRSSTNFVPIIHRPRPGGVHFRWKRRSNASLAVFCALASFHSSPNVTTCCFCILNIPSTTRRHVCHHSSVPCAHRRRTH